MLSHNKNIYIILHYYNNIKVCNMRGIISIQSHVVYGCAGNSSAVFPLQRLGFNVWPIQTVQFSNHNAIQRRLDG